MLLKPYTIADLLGTVKAVLGTTAIPDGQIALNWQSQPLPNRLQL